LWNRASQEIGPLFLQEFLLRFLVKFENPPKICARCPLQPRGNAHRRRIAVAMSRGYINSASNHSCVFAWGAMVRRAGLR